MKPELFLKNERIIRHITDAHYNPTTKKLRSNFVGFALNINGSKKYELSCNRFEMEDITHCHFIGKINVPPDKKYLGFACTTVSAVKENPNYSFFYSPMFNKEIYLNYSHSDVYDNSLPGVPKHELGEALTSKVNLDREVFIKKWKVYSQNESQKKSQILPH